MIATDMEVGYVRDVWDNVCPTKSGCVVTVHTCPCTIPKVSSTWWAAVSEDSPRH